MFIDGFSAFYRTIKTYSNFKGLKMFLLSKCLVCSLHVYFIEFFHSLVFQWTREKCAKKDTEPVAYRLRKKRRFYNSGYVYNVFIPKQPLFLTV